MRPTGKRSNIRVWRKVKLRRLLAACLVLISVSGARPVRALDVFTLWRQPEIPLQINEGNWVEYRTLVMAGGRQEESLTRIVCLDRDHGSDDETWLLELLPLVEENGRTRPLPGEGMQLRLSRSLLNREGTFMEAIVSAVQWREGQAEPISREELRDDPLVAASLAASFRPDRVERQDPTTRVIEGKQFLCDQFVMAAADTQVAELPAGRMIQVTTREIVAAVHEEVPFLGLTYLTERVRAESRLDPPSRRMKAPPPRVRVEVMELVAFGLRADPTLVAAD